MSRLTQTEACSFSSVGNGVILCASRSDRLIAPLQNRSDLTLSPATRPSHGIASNLLNL